MEELQKKQLYLRMNILERGYDAEIFMNFLKSKKGDLGLDLNNWTLNELTSAVHEFMTIEKNINKEGLEQGQNNENDDTNLMQMEIEQNTNKFHSQEEFIHCEKIVPNELSQSDDVDIKLSFPEKVEGGLFTKSYVTYLMQTFPMGYQVRKRYSEFDWLRNILSTIYVNCVIPPLCKKNYPGRFNELLIAKRTRSIEKFMKGILIHPIMRNSEIFYNFISIDKDTEFEKKKKEYNRISSPVILNQFRSLTGELKVTVSKDKEIYLENIKDNLDFNENLLQKITKGYKALILLMEQLNDKMKEISGLWKEMYKKSMQYFERPNTLISYDIMSKIMMDWSEINKKQKILINEGIREYFRYVKNEFHSIKDLTLKVDSQKIIFTKAFDKLISQKESTFRQDISQWGLTSVDMENKAQLLTNKNLAFSKMLPKETRKVDELRQNYGFYLNSVISEFERIRELNSKRHKNTIQIFIKDFAESLKDFQIYLGDRESYYDEIKVEKDKKDETEQEQIDDDDENKNEN